jgi:hypothetical protein
MKRYIGRKTKAWTKERNKQKRESLINNQMYCQFRFEGCTGTENLGYSHPSKRRYTTDLSDCVLACGNYHRHVENIEQSEKIRLHEEARARGIEAYYRSA